MTCQVDGLTVDNALRPAQWLNRWIFVETVLIRLRKTEDYSLLGCQRRSKDVSSP